MTTQELKTQPLFLGERGPRTEEFAVATAVAKAAHARPRVLKALERAATRAMPQPAAA